MRELEGRLSEASPWGERNGLVVSLAHPPPTIRTIKDSSIAASNDPQDYEIIIRTNRPEKAEAIQKLGSTAIVTAVNQVIDLAAKQGQTFKGIKVVAVYSFRSGDIKIIARNAKHFELLLTQEKEWLSAFDQGTRLKEETFQSVAHKVNIEAAGKTFVEGSAAIFDEILKKNNLEG
ncbi:hypothetical protein Z517_06457 [Fonsecaea pedrosoi CBS 271.37]|uniref:Uncharacterized protein n=1 Tax=Fonsecaea pedrosoi CBS 271.37 TaxID=1442368 RepID=A0A0D2EZR5_9EURO|nr:uncharacterized protein Z517_06457 [Fonsecaea pedrosoi CBS 271.37]KIW79842.1 hypothetical protein Z517_06457 [Fonsecaea pedrosoi CBS 271.37]